MNTKIVILARTLSLLTILGLFSMIPAQSSHISSNQSFEIKSEKDKIEIFNEKEFHNISLAVSVTYGSIEIVWYPPNLDVHISKVISPGKYDYNIVTPIVEIRAFSTKNYSEKSNSSLIVGFMEKNIGVEISDYYANGTYRILDYGIVNLPDVSPLEDLLIFGLMIVFIPLGIITFILLLILNKKKE